MTQIALFRKAVFLCAAVMATASLSACDNSNLGETFAKIKAIQVDDSGQPSDKKLTKADVELAVNTAKDLTVGKDGLLHKDASGNLQISVVDPLKVPPPDDGSRLDERTGTRTFTIAQLEAMRALPDVPIAQAAYETVVAAPAPKPAAVIKVAETSSVRLIQVGSFGSTAAAQQAWTSLQSRYPGIGRYSPSYQKITTAAGKSMVRLKVGPVASDGQAKALCGQLDINDAWCSKAG